MTVIRTVATHEIVQAVYPRAPTERDRVGMAVGKAIDGAMARFSHEAARGWRPTARAINALAESILDEELVEVDLELPPEERTRALATVAEVLRVFRKSELFGLPRPRTRLILIQGEVGVYAQPYYWYGRARIIEMKSYRAWPPSPEVALQLDLFQLAFPGFDEFLACFDRHASPVTATLDRVPAVSETRREELLRTAHRIGLAQGREKVLEYIDSQAVRYVLPGAPPS